MFVVQDTFKTKPAKAYALVEVFATAVATRKPPLRRWLGAACRLCVGAWFLAGLPASAQEGKAAFERGCAICHGAVGEGGSAPALVPLSDSYNEVLRVVRGGGSEMMMAFSQADVSDEQVRQIHAYLRGLTPSEAASAPQSQATAGTTALSSQPQVAVAGAPASPGNFAPMVEWPYVGGDPSNTRYSSLDDLTVENVEGLELAWTWRPEEGPMPEFGTIPGNFTSTPLMIDGVVYVSTNYNRVAALDAVTGAVKWIFDPRAYELGMPLLGGGFRHRGVAAWRDGDKLRIFLASRYRLFSLDAQTGQPVESFGQNGRVDTAKDLSWEVDPSHFEVNAPPAIYGDIVILGSAIGDRPIYKRMPPGDIRAYHASTGELAWTWSPIPKPGEFGADSWEGNALEYAGQVEVWPGVTVDRQLGLVFAPTGNPTNLYYGGGRLGDNLFAGSLVALDAVTGERRWHYQIVHHGLWDYSLPAQSILVDITVDGQPIKAVVQLTKQGYVFVFDRATGAPVWPIEEKPVPPSDVPGERTSPTQPAPTLPLHVLPSPGVKLEDAFDLTPELQAAAQTEMRKYRLGPLFTPPSLEGTLVRPTGGGAVSWGGGAFDPETGMIYMKVSDQAGVLGVEKFDPETTRNRLADKNEADWIGYDVVRGSAAFMGGVPLTKPPYAYLIAINLNTGQLAWRVPFGRGSEALRNHSALRGVTLPERLGTPGPPGAIVTKGGLVFIGGGDEALYAFDKSTGREVWDATVPRRTAGIPMTYRAANGRQYVLITTGSGSDQELMAFALPESRE
jgi:quinoprotein glucose dehydrogenase